ncbi:MAG: aldo/keto reductase [Gemmatimonadota bacterium]|nr:aldo/keto reductase [Gemmatimonadota bacterium]
MLERPIPSSGENIPIVGLGTWQAFDVGPSPADRTNQRETLRRFAEGGGRVVDASPMYGRAERVVGDLAGELGVAGDLFMATKVWTEGRQAGVDQMETSMRLMRARPMDLMQVHNLVDVETHLATIREWKAEGIVRYVGITHYQVRAFHRLEELIRSHDLDFVQLNYSMATPDAERRLLGVAADHGTAVLVNRPYEGGSLFRAVRGRDLPPLAADLGCASWGQFFLKYLLGAPEVTCVIPGTDDPEHVLDNLGAGRGRLPDEAERRRMIEILAG